MAEPVVTKALIQQRTTFADPCRVAAEGFRQLGHEVLWFPESEDPTSLLSADTVLVAGVSVFRRALAAIGIQSAFETYPTQLRSRLAGPVTIATLADAWRMPPGFFVKPVDDAKAFSGVAVTREEDLRSTLSASPDTEVYISPINTPVSEYRCFVLRREVIGVRHYKGSPMVFPQPAAIQEAVDAWDEQPIAWALDVGVLSSGTTCVVEANDAHSIGDYGLAPVAYARFLEARWCELAGAKPMP